jgi:hypothetical protein
MDFFSKQPSVVARVMNATGCPPHDMLHNIEDYSVFYDPLYFPQLYLSIFESEKKLPMVVEQLEPITKTFSYLPPLSTNTFEQPQDLFPQAIQP